MEEREPERVQRRPRRTHRQAYTGSRPILLWLVEPALLAHDGVADAAVEERETERVQRRPRRPIEQVGGAHRVKHPLLDVRLQAVWY